MFVLIHFCASRILFALTKFFARLQLSVQLFEEQVAAGVEPATVGATEAADKAKTALQTL